MATAENQSPRVSFDESNERPYVMPNSQGPEYSVGDRVKLLNSDGSREGPYLITSVTAAGKYTIGREGSEAVKNGEEIDGDYLEKAAGRAAVR